MYKLHVCVCVCVLQIGKHFPYFEKIKVCLYDHHAVCVSVYSPH
jgi:hypothetical protein